MTRWTKVRRAGLERLAAAPATGLHRGLRISNNGERGNLYWQTADWLCASGFASVDRIDPTRVVMTVRGRDVVNVWERES